MNAKRYQKSIFLILISTILWLIYELHFLKFIHWGSASRNMLYFSFGASFLCYLTGALNKKYFFYSIVIPPLILIIYVTGFVPILSIFTLFLASRIVAGFIFTSIGLKKQDVLHSLIQTVFGLGIYASVIGAFAFFPINNILMYWSILLLPIILIPKELKLIKVESNHIVNATRSYLIDQPKLFFFVYAILFLYLIVSLMPDFGWDSLAMHLYIPSYVESHALWPFDINQYIWASWPLNTDWIYTLIQVLGGGENGIRLVVFFFIFLLSALLIKSTSEFISKKMGLLAGLILLSMPLTFLEISTVFTELFWTLLIVSFFIILRLFHISKEKNYIYIFSILAGMALATKMITIAMLLPLAFIVIYLVYKKNSFNFFQIIWYCFLLTLLFGAEPYLIAYLKSGNPVFPLYNYIFKSKLFSEMNFYNITRYYNYKISILTLRDITFQSDKFIEGWSGGAIGLVYFVILPVAFFISLFNKLRHALVLFFISLIFIILVFTMQSYLRYIYAAFPIIIYFMLAAINSTRKIFPTFYNFTNKSIVVLTVLSVSFFPVCTQGYSFFDFKFFQASKDRKDLIYKLNPIRHAIDDINLKYDENSRIAFFCNPLGAGLKGVAYYANWYNNNFIFAIYAAHSKEDMRKILNDYKIDSLIFDENFNPNGGFPQLANFIKNATVLEKEYGQGISVRTIKKY